MTVIINEGSLFRMKWCMDYLSKHEITLKKVKGVNQMNDRSYLNDRLKIENAEELKINLHSNIQPRKEYHFKPLILNFNERIINLYRCSMDLTKLIELAEHPVLTVII